jgi:hypothetical protein
MGHPLKIKGRKVRADVKGRETSGSFDSLRSLRMTNVKNNDRDSGYARMRSERYPGLS